MITNCLTYEQLEAYSTGDITKAERSNLYTHISSCELCACAVNGFTALPFASDELVAIHREIDARVNATAAHPLTLAQVFIVLISILSIAGVYTISDHKPGHKTIAAVVKTKEPIALKPVSHETEKTSQEKVPAAATALKKTLSVIEYKKAERRITPVEELEMLEPISILDKGNGLSNDASEIVASHFNPAAIYIYDLKVSDYNKLYFPAYSTNDPSLFKTHTPVFKENKDDVADDFGIEKWVIAPDKVLKAGLAAYNKQQFNVALDQFNLLLKNNAWDVNAQFYSALSYYNLNKPEQAIERLQLVMKNPNDTFYPEAQWCLALLAIKTGDLPSAKAQLETIVAEKGFYAKKAKEKLKLTVR